MGRCKIFTHIFYEFIKGNPALHFVMYPDKKGLIISGFGSFLNFFLQILFLYGHYHFYIGGLNTVFDVVGCELDSCRNGYCPYFVQGRKNKPKLVSSSQKKQNRVASSYSHGLKKVGCFIYLLCQFSERKYPFFGFIAPYESLFFGVFLSHSVYYIISKIKIFGSFD